MPQLTKNIESPKSTNHPMQVRPRLAETIARRKQDWRVGTLIYQIYVDRFERGVDLASKQEHYSWPRRLREWNEKPRRGKYNEEAKVSEHQIEFWGGDLKGVLKRLDYIQELGIETIYLNPIFEAYTNHKYDALDYFKIDPQFGTFDDLRKLTDDLHGRGMKILLDGVFNHMGKHSPMFKRAMEDTNAPEREFFDIHPDYRHGFRSWRNGDNLPELNVENPDVRKMLFEGPDSVVQHYLKDPGIDGWRLDVAPDLGFHWLKELTRNAHEAHPDCVVIGECWNYPEEWFESLDGVMNMHVRLIILSLIERKLNAAQASRMIERMIDDAGIEGMLRSHLVIDNHDVPRIGTLIRDEKERRLATILQFTLPGCPVIYYGSELGMAGGADPENRAPMRWDLLRDGNPTLELHKEMIRLRNENPAMVVGDYRALDSQNLLAFMRQTEYARETLLILINPSKSEVHDLIAIRDSRLMDASPLECLLTGTHVMTHCGLIEVKMPPQSAHIFRTVDRGNETSYSMFKRVP